MLKLIPKNHPMLSEPSEKFDFKNQPMDPTKLFTDLKTAMLARGGLGLSAVQVGIPYAAFVMGNPADPDSVFSVFNPIIVDYMGESIGMEGCLTQPGIFININRAESIRVRFSGHDGETDTMHMNGLSARIFQHEYDHLQGKQFTDGLSKLKLDRAKNQKRKLDRARKDNYEIYN